MVLGGTPGVENSDRCISRSVELVSHNYTLIIKVYKKKEKKFCLKGRFTIYETRRVASLTIAPRRIASRRVALFGSQNSIHSRSVVNGD